MSEIEKMYKNARILPRRKCEFYENCPLGFTHSCDDCYIEFRESNSSYPPFTAEKQIELIKWLGELDMLEIIRTTREDKVWIINSEYGMSWNVYKYTSRMKSFEEALARLINSLWQDLTVEEQQQIKEILG